MVISVPDAVPVFAEVKKIQETLRAYCLAGDHIPPSIDDILYAIEQEYAANIQVQLYPFKSDLVRGFIRIYSRDENGALRARIVVDSDLNRSQHRYVQVKETTHVVIHNAENCTPDPTKIIEYYVQETVMVANGAGESDDVKNEMLADLAACELLFPHALREPARQRILSGADTIFDLADWLELPEHVVEYVLGDRYMHFADAVWAALGGCHAA